MDNDGGPNKEERINFLEKILQIAKNNPKIITNKGRCIFYYNNSVFDEECTIGLYVDEKGKPYFRAMPDVVEYSRFPKGLNPSLNKLYEAEYLLMAAGRYFSKKLDDFKNNFHLYETIKSDADLLDEIR